MFWKADGMVRVSEQSGNKPFQKFS